MSRQHYLSISNRTAWPLPGAASLVRLFGTKQDDHGTSATDMQQPLTC
jgi:hypothetical protein